MDWQSSTHKSVTSQSQVSLEFSYSPCLMNIGFKQERLRFTHGDRMRTYSDVINQATTESLDLHSGQIFDVRTVTQSITLRVIMQAVFGLDRGERAEQLEQVLKVQAIVRGAFA